MIESQENQYIIKIGINTSTIHMTDINEFYFIEDIYSTVITGYFSFYDRSGMFEKMPLTGNEFITVLYSDSENDTVYELYFSIFQIKNISMIIQSDGSSLALVELYFVDPRFYYLNQFRYSRSWPDDTFMSDIVWDICINMLLIPEDLIVQFDGSKEKISNFYMPYWTPNEAIKWLMKRMSNIDNGISGYVFYIDKNGLNFVSIETLLLAQDLEVDDDGKIKQYSFYTNNITDENKILSWSIHPIDSQSTNYLRGTTKIGYNFENKKVENRPFTYKDIVDDYTLLGTKTFFSDMSNPDNSLFELEGDSDFNRLNNMASSEIINRYLNEFSVMITVRGAARRYPGMIVDIDWPSTDTDQYYHPSLNGKYLVKSITNYFNPNIQPYFQQKMVLLKTAYSESNSKVLMNASKYNLDTSSQKVGTSK